MQVATKNTVLGQKVVFDSEMNDGEIVMSPGTLSQIWANGIGLVHLQAGVPDTESNFPRGIGNHPNTRGE